MEKPILIIKICGYRSPQRYSVERAVRTALNLLQEKYPEVQISIHEVIEVKDILKYTQVLLYPGLVINEKLVCAGRFPKHQEVYEWLEKAINEN